MKTMWKWLAVAACGAGLLWATDRFRFVTASEAAPEYGSGGDLGDKIDRLAEKLDRLLNRMDGRAGRGGPPRGDHDGPPHHGPGDRDLGPHRGHGHHADREHGMMPGGRPEWGGPPGGPRGGMPPEMRERFEQARGAMQERMEKARERFQQLEERVKSLETEVERLKTSRQG